MPISMSTGLRNRMLSGNSLKGIFDPGSEIRIYGGPVPASANDAIGAAVLLCTIKNGASGVTFAATAVNGVLEKNATETWSGTVTTAGTATFYRHVLTGDADNASSTAPRYQGTVALAGADMNLTNPALLLGAVQTLDYFATSING